MNIGTLNSLKTPAINANHSNIAGRVTQPESNHQQPQVSGPIDFSTLSFESAGADTLGSGTLNLLSALQEDIPDKGQDETATAAGNAGIPSSPGALTGGGGIGNVFGAHGQVSKVDSEFKSLIGRGGGGLGGMLGGRTSEIDDAEPSRTNMMRNRTDTAKNSLRNIN